MNNENKTVSRNRERRIQRKIKMDDKMKSILNSIKSEKKKKHIDKIKELEIELVKIKYCNNPNKVQIVLKELNIIQFVDENLHEIKIEMLGDYTGEFELIGGLRIGGQVRTTHIRFRNMDDFESYINAIDQDYKSEDANFNGYIHKTNTPQFNLINRSHNGNGCDFKHEIIQYRGYNCFIPSKGCCFVRCNDFLTGGDYKQQYLDFFRNEKRRSNLKTKARFQPFCRANNINLVYFDGTRVFPRSATDRENALFLYNNHFCLIWKSGGVNSNHAFKEFKRILKKLINI